MSAQQTVVLELVQIVQGVVLFGDHRHSPDVAISFPRKGWDEMGNPTVITVSATPGGDFVPKPDSDGLATGVNVEQALAKLGATGAYL